MQEFQVEWGIAGVTLSRSVTPDVNSCMTNEDRSTSSQAKSNAFQHLPEIWLVPNKLLRALGNLAGSCIPPPPHQQKITICKGRNPSLFSVSLHALTNSMFPSSQAGRKTEEAASGTRQPGDAAAKGPFVEHPWAPLAFYLGMQSPWQRAGVPWRSRSPAAPAAEPHLHPAAEPRPRTAPLPAQPSAPQRPPAAGPGGPAGLTCCLRGTRWSPALGMQRGPPEGLRGPPGWLELRPRWVWPAAGTGSRRRRRCRISASAYYAGENGLLVGAFQPLRHPVAGISQGRNLFSRAAALPRLTASAG